MPHVAIVKEKKETSTSTRYVNTMLRLACMYLQALYGKHGALPYTCTPCSRPAFQPQIHQQALVDTININRLSFICSGATMPPDEYRRMPTGHKQARQTDYIMLLHVCEILILEIPLCELSHGCTR